MKLVLTFLFLELFFPRVMFIFPGGTAFSPSLALCLHYPGRVFLTSVALNVMFLNLLLCTNMG